MAVARSTGFEPDWPGTLTGFAKRAYDFWQKELEPQGYKLRPDHGFPGGVRATSVCPAGGKTLGGPAEVSHSELQGVAWQDRFMLRCSKKP
jgi:hypothetical protein